MKRKNQYNPLQSLFYYLLTALMLTTLAGCNSSSSGTTSSTLSGTAATGAAMDGFVYVVDVNGTEVNVAINGDGSYTVNVDGMTAPYMLRAVPSNTGLPTQYSYAGQANVTVNVTPLTTLAMFMANSQGDLAALAQNWATQASQITATNLANAQAIINANLATQLTNGGLEPTTYDFFGTAFSADGSGFDGVLDGLTVNVDMSGGTFNVAVTGVGGFSFNASIDTTGYNIGGGSSGGTGSGGLPAGVASKIGNMTYNEIASGAPYTNGQQVMFTFSSSGALMLTDQYTVVANTFTESGGEYIWTDTGNGLEYRLSLTAGGDINEVNLFTTGGTFLGQFDQFTEVNLGGSSSTQFDLTISGTYLINGVSVNVPATTLNGPFAVPSTSDVQAAATNSYGATGTVSVVVQVDIPTQKKFRVSFDGMVGGIAASYVLIYDYNAI